MFRNISQSMKISRLYNEPICIVKRHYGVEILWKGTVSGEFRGFTTFGGTFM